MDVDAYFAPAMELSSLLYAYHNASAEEKQTLADKIHNCSYLVRLRKLQSHADRDDINGFLPNKPIMNASKRSFFVNYPVPCDRESDSAARESMPYHRHDFVELIVVLRGDYLQVVNGCEYRHTAGDVCMLSPNITHRDYVPKSDERVLYMGLSKSFLHGELAEFFDKHPHLRNFMKYQSHANEQQFILFHPSNTERPISISMQIAEEDWEKRPGHHLVIKGLLVRLFDLLLQNHREEIICQTAEGIEKTLVAEMLDYISRNISTVNRGEMARFFHYNPDYLNRTLLRTTGRTFSQNVKEIRLQSAARQLVETKQSVNTIIRELGFSNKSYFNRIFSERYGVLPGQYREQ